MRTKQQIGIMPCRVDLSPEEELTILRGQHTELRNSHKVLEEKLKDFDEVTAMLCAVMRYTDGKHKVDLKFKSIQEELAYKIKGLRRWWEKHQEEDNRRLKQEQKVIRDQVRSKLLAMHETEREVLIDEINKMLKAKKI